MGLTINVPRTGAEPVLDAPASRQMTAEPTQQAPAQPGAPARKAPAISAAFGTGGGAAIVFHDFASI